MSSAESSDFSSRRQQSSSVPSSPHHSPKNCAYSSSSSSAPRRSNSPPNAPVAAIHPQPPRKTQWRFQPYQPCKYETFLALQKRRMPYSLGGDPLPRETGIKEKLTPEEERRLTRDMDELYERLLPTKESDARREKFLQKVERLLKERWPSANIGVHVFGSSGNKLCTSESDVDISVTSSDRELESTCTMAAFFAKNGMERLVCVPHAKVPIIKMWDPGLNIACDMNVNNTSAIENTRMIRTYVDCDDRVRPLAMIIKYWTKRRQLNEAALGNTISSYTWILLIINFLQTRSPPVLPSLHRRRSEKVAAKQTPETTDSIPPTETTNHPVRRQALDASSFDDDLEELRGFGSANTSTLGTLLFGFFRYYAYEIDYDTAVISVREGKVLSKEYKGWHLLQNNRICVEEPFNTSRNLGNTADDSSSRGLHIELRRAFDLLNENGVDGGLRRCCEIPEPPSEEEEEQERRERQRERQKTWERSVSMPVSIKRPQPPSAAPQQQQNSSRMFSNQRNPARGSLNGGRHMNAGASQNNYPPRSSKRDVSSERSNNRHLNGSAATNNDHNPTCPIGTVGGANLFAGGGGGSPGGLTPTELANLQSPYFLQYQWFQHQQQLQYLQHQFQPKAKSQEQSPPKGKDMYQQNPHKSENKSIHRGRDCYQ